MTHLAAHFGRMSPLGPGHCKDDNVCVAADALSEAESRAREGDYVGALAWRERAFTALRAAGETGAAARLAAYQIAFDHAALFGNTAVSQGWLARGISLAEEAGPTADAGWVALARALYARGQEREVWIEAAERTARDFHDADLHFDSLAYRGLLLVEGGRVTEGMRRLDEAATAAYSGEVQSRTVAGEIYCKLMVACETVLDVHRAEQWHRVFGALGAELEVAWASAICTMHEGAIWTAAGRWDEADRALRRSLALYEATYGALRPAASARLAELRVRQGRPGEAERLLADGASDGFALRPTARVAWQAAATTTERHAAVAALSAGLASRRGSLGCIPDLALLTELQVACGKGDEARASVDLIDMEVTDDIGPGLMGHVLLARALVAALDHDGAATDLLHRAVRSFVSAGLPLEAARAGLAAAEVEASTDPGSALLMAREAAATLAGLGVTTEMDRAAALVRNLGGRLPSAAREAMPLTRRESQVLALVAAGLSNPEVARQLFLSKRTVAHHVSSVLAKLGLRNRGEAAAWFIAREGDVPRQ